MQVNSRSLSEKGTFIQPCPKPLPTMRSTDAPSTASATIVAATYLAASVVPVNRETAPGASLNWDDDG
jgi:hypothetical protein